MQKSHLLLLFAALLTSFMSAQSQSLTAKWTTDQKIILEALPAIGQNVLLDVPARWSHQVSELKAACEKMSDPISTWKLSENGASFIITLNRETNPKWLQKDWEMYINRVVGVYLP